MSNRRYEGKELWNPCDIKSAIEHFYVVGVTPGSFLEGANLQH